MKIFALLILVLLSSCTKKTIVLNEQKKITPPIQNVVNCSGNLFDGSLSILDLDLRVNPIGASSNEASFVLSGDKCIIQSCDNQYEVESDGLSCSPIACNLNNSGINNALTVNGDLVNGCGVSSCESNYISTNGTTCDPIACTVANSNILNSLTVSGSLVSGCQVDTCESNYLKVGNVCQAISCNITKGVISKGLNCRV